MSYSSEVLADSPLAYYRLGEATGASTMVDASGNSRDGAFVTNAGAGTTCTAATGLLVGDANGALAFAGGAYNGKVTDAAWMDVTTASLEAWFATTDTGNGMICGRWPSSGTSNAYMYVDLQSSNVIRVYAQIGGSTRIASATVTGLRDGNPHHVVGTYDGSTLLLYVDGAQVATLTIAGTLPAVARDFQVGSRSGATGDFDGTIDEVAYYTGALSAARVEAHFDVGTGAASAGSMSLAGTLATKTASFTVATVLAASLVGSMQPKTASFAVETEPFGTVELAGSLQPKTAAFTVDLPVRNVELAGELPRKTASIEILASAQATLAGTMQAKAAGFSILADASVALAGTLQPKTAAHSLTTNPLITIVGSLQAKTAAFTMESGKTLTLAGSMRRKTSVITIASNPAVRLDATLRAKTAAISVDAQPTLWLTGTLQPKLATFVAYAVTPVTPSPVVGAQAVVVARAFGPVTMQGTQPVYAISSAYIPRARQRILVDNIDVTYFRGGITPDIPYTLIEPLLYGPATLDVPQVSACFERLGVGALSWLRPGAPVEVQRVLDDVVVGTDWKGVIVAFDTTGRNLSVELGGEASGRAALRNRQVPIFPRTNDLGRQFADSITDLGLPFYPHLGPTTGIEAMTTGGVGHLEYIQALVAKAWTRAGKHWTIMPDEATGAYEAHRKDDETIHGTVFIDDARTVANLRRDISEEPNRIYATGVTPKGKRVRFGVYPGLVQGPTPDFPGHMELGDTGDGVRLLIGKLHAMGYLKLTDSAGGYDQDVYDAVVDLQIDAGLFDEGFVGSAVPGEVNETTWNHLYDLGTTGNSLEWAHIEPAAQRRKVRPWNRSASGGIMGVNPLHDPNHLVRDRNVEINGNRSQMREFSRTVLHDSDDANWVGDIVFNTGALIRGDGFEGMTVTEADVLDARELRPGMNLDLPQFDGGTFAHIAAIQVNDEGIVTATVDTRFRDALEVWEVIARNKESRNDPARRRNQKHRSSTIVKDSIGEWDEIGGLLGNDVPLEAGWNVFEVIGAMEGTIAKLRLMVGDASTVVIQGDGDETIIENLDGQEFACAVFGRSITADRLNTLIPAPLTVAGTKLWETKRSELDERWILYSAGTHDEPCGYSPGRKHFKAVEAEEPNPDYDPDTDPDSERVITVITQESWGNVTGKHVDDAGFAYRSESRTVLHVAVWVRNEATLLGGRIMWPQLEAGA